MRLRLCHQATVVGVTVAIISTGVWWRVRRWGWAGHRVTWSCSRLFSERIGVTRPLWQIGSEKRWRIACFPLERMPEREDGRP